MEIIRYSVKSGRLRPWVKHIWQLCEESADFHYKLLPTECIDVILNLKSEMEYETQSGRVTAPDFHINGLRSRPSFIYQRGEVHTFGISFYPYGLFPFVSVPLTGLREKIAALREFSPELEAGLKSAISENEIAPSIERELLALLPEDETVLQRALLVRDFLAGETSMKEFCAVHGVSVKTLERTALAYTGYTPKLLLDIKRFQNASNQLSHQREESLAGIACDNDFVDQAHFSKDFKKFSGAAPGVFLSEKATVKENVKYKFL